MKTLLPSGQLRKGWRADSRVRRVEGGSWAQCEIPQLLGFISVSNPCWAKWASSTGLRKEWTAQFPSIRPNSHSAAHPLELLLSHSHSLVPNSKFRLLLEHHWRGARSSHFPSTMLFSYFLAFLYLCVFTVPGILCVQGDYGHFKDKTGAKQRQVLENSLQNTTDGITAAKTTHSLKAVVV